MSRGKRIWVFKPRYRTLLGIIFLLLGVAGIPDLARAWNEEHAYALPQERRMCVRRDGENGLIFSSIAPDEDCPQGERRFIVIFGKEPRGAMALIPTATSLRFFPPLVLNWPAGDRFSASPLWHFTCLAREELQSLGVKLGLPRYRGEITSRGKEDCLEAEKRALSFCQKEWQGESLLETCPLSWSGQ